MTCASKLPAVTASLPALMPLEEMAQLYDALRTIKSVIDGLMCQRRFDSNMAGAFLDDLNVALGLTCDKISDRAAARSAKSSDEFSLRAEILILQQFHCEGITSAADLAAKLYGPTEPVTWEP